MAHMVKFAAGLGLSALLLTAGCATSPSVSPEEAAERQARLAAISLLPECADAELLTGKLTDRIPDCRMTVKRSRLLLTVNTDPVSPQVYGPSGLVTISIVDRRGSFIGEFSEIISGDYAYPRLKDANGDGLQDLIIPRDTGAKNGVCSLWLQQDNGDFTHAGEVSGCDTSWADRGLIAAARQTGNAELETGDYRVHSGELHAVALIRAKEERPPGLRDPCAIVEMYPSASPESFCIRR